MGNSNLCRVVRQYLLLLILVAVTSVGCSKKIPTGTVKGKVTLDDQPYSNASVVLLGVDSGQAGSADIQSDGTFSIAEPLPVGKYTVYLAPKASATNSEEAAPVSIDTTVPDKYWNEMSDIKVDLAEGPNEITVPLKKGG